MDGMVPGLQTPDGAVPRTDRRRRVRHRLHSPIFASFRSTQAGVEVDLSELLDLTEDGFAVHTPQPLEVDRPVALTLDLPETKTYIHDHGLVIWSGPSSHAGVRFSNLSDANRRLLKQWLFANLLVAAAHYAARTEQLSPGEEPVAEPVAEPSQPLPDSGVPTPPPDPAKTSATAASHAGQSETTAAPDQAVAEEPRSAVSESPAPVLKLMFSAVEAVGQKVRAYGDDLDASLHLIAACALGLTDASGAAVALLADGEMICRARAGDHAPPLGASVDVRHGISGECVRSGQIVRVDDIENDERVDRESCRTLGIGAILAIPIVADSRVVGLLEGFSPNSHNFTKTHEAVLDRLAKIVPTAGLKVPAPADTSLAAALFVTPQVTPEADPGMHAVRDALWDQESVQKALRSEVSVHNLYLGLMGLVVAVAALVSGYLLAPAIQRQWFRSSTPRATASTVAAAGQSTSGRTTVASSSEDLRNLAEAGDVDAQYFLAIRYHTGTNVAQDDTQAVKWFERAANQGHVLAQATLPSYYWSGIGVPKDPSKAYFWAAVASAQGDENSKTTLEGLSTQMARSQIDAARRQADNWLRQHNASPKPAKPLSSTPSPLKPAQP